MKKYLTDYIDSLQTLLNKNKLTKKDLENIKIKISFFQHERLIHLLVTLFYVCFDLFFFSISLLSNIFLIPFFMGLIFILFYIRHYFFLESRVQYLYKLYDKALEITKDQK